MNRATTKRDVHLDRRLRISCAAGCLAWLCFVYGTNGFLFGVANNVEELPAIYYVAGVADFPHDPMVNGLVSRWNQASPYIYLLGGLVRTSGVDGAPWLFLSLHIALMTITYLALRRILIALGGWSEWAIFASLLVLFWIDQWRILPSERVLFFNFMDPEHVSIVFCLASVASLVQDKWRWVAVHISIATIVHPLYGLPLIGCLWWVLAVRWQRKEDAFSWSARAAVGCGAVGLTYAVLLWLHDSPSGPALWDVSQVQEAIRSPHCHVIPHLDQAGFWQAWLPLVVLVGVAWLSNRFRAQSSANEGSITRGCPRSVPRHQRELITIISLLLVYMLLASLVDAAIRIPLLVKLTPYRMAVVVFPLLWTLALTVGLASWSVPRWLLSPQLRGLASVCLAVLSMAYAAQARTVSFALYPHKGPWLNSAGSEVLRFIRDETSSADVFLNYSDLDLRSAALRSDIFRFKTIPLYSEAQLHWYHRLLAVNDVPKEIPHFDYELVRDYIQQEREISLREVIDRLDQPVDYILINRRTTFVDPFVSCNGRGNLARFDPQDLVLVLENDTYAVYHVWQRTQET